LPPQLPLGSLYMEEVHAKVCPYWPFSEIQPSSY
jgi:hypothetical protein